MTSAIYSYPWLYRFAMKIRFGEYYAPRLSLVADEIPFGAKVVDLCCGDSAIYKRHLRSKQVDYLGVDINKKMIEKIRKKGINAMVADIRDWQPPPADVVICLGALLHFPKEAPGVIERSMKAAKKVVIIEPVRYGNLLANPFSAAIAAHVCDFGEGPVHFRFSEDELAEIWRGLGVSRIESIGPEIMGVWEQ